MPGGRGRPAAWRELSPGDGAEGREAFIVGGTYREVEPPARLAYTWRWETGVLDVRLKSGQGLGANYEQGVKGPGGRRVPADYEITAYEPDKRIAFRAIWGPVRPQGAHELEPVEGGTRVTFSLSCSPRGFVKLMTPIVAKTMRAEVAQLERLREVLEG